MDNECWALVDELLRNGDPLGALRAIDDPIVLDEIVRGLARSIYEHGCRPVLANNPNTGRSFAPGVASAAPRGDVWPGLRLAPDDGHPQTLRCVDGGRCTATAGKG